MKKFFPALIITLVVIAIFLVQNKSDKDNLDIKVSCDIKIVNKDFISGDLVRSKTKNC